MSQELRSRDGGGCYVTDPVPGDLTGAEGTFFFSVGHFELWRNDGTAAGSFARARWEKFCLSPTALCFTAPSH